MRIDLSLQQKTSLSEQVANAIQIAAVAMLGLTLTFGILFGGKVKQGGQQPPQQLVVDVGLWQVQEVAVTNTLTWTNAYTQGELTATVNGPGAEDYVLPGFVDSTNGRTWKLRFACRVVGTHSWSAVMKKDGSPITATPLSGSYNCVSSSEPGFLRVSDDDRHLATADGEPFYWNGDTFWAGLNTTVVSTSQFDEYVTARSQQGFNASLLAVYNSELSATAFQGTNTDMLNISYFTTADQRVTGMLASGIDPMLFPQWGHDKQYFSSTQHRRFFTYLVARYAAYDILWSVSGEFQTCAVGDCSLASWNALGNHLHATDPYQHLTGIHPGGYSAPHTSAWAFGNQAWVDVILEQTYAWDWDRYAGLQYTNGCGDPRTVPSHIVRQLINRVARDDWNGRMDSQTGQFIKPVINVELHYEGGGLPYSHCNTDATSTAIRKNHWSAVMAGAYQTYGKHAIACCNIFRSSELQSTGVSYIQHLNSFFTTLQDWWRYVPQNALVDYTGGGSYYGYALTIPGESILAYIINGGSFRVDLRSFQGGLTANWYDPRDGSTESAGQVNGGSWANFSRPNGEDWALIVQVLAPTNEPPTVTLVDPDEGEVVSGVYPVRAENIADTDGTVTTLRFLVDTVVQHTVTNPGATETWAWATAGLAHNSQHTITVEAIDDDGDTAIDNATVTVLQPLLLDDFQDHNANGWVTQGGAWSVVNTDEGPNYYYRETSGTGTNKHAIASGQSWSAANGPLTIQSRVKLTNTADAIGILGYTAAADPSLSYRLAFNRATNRLQISENGVVRAEADVTMTTSDWYVFQMRFETNGSSITVHANAWKEADGMGTAFSLTPWVDTTPLAAGSAGFYCFRAAQCRFDDLLVSQIPQGGGGGSPSFLKTIPSAPIDDPLPD